MCHSYGSRPKREIAPARTEPHEPHTVLYVVSEPLRDGHGVINVPRSLNRYRRLPQIGIEKLQSGFTMEHATPVWPLVLYCVAVIALVGGMTAVSYVLGQRHTSKATVQPFEVRNRDRRLRAVPLAREILPRRDVLRNLRPGDGVHLRLGHRVPRRRLGRIHRTCWCSWECWSPPSSTYGGSAPWIGGHSGNARPLIIGADRDAVAIDQSGAGGQRTRLMRRSSDISF